MSISRQGWVVAYDVRAPRRLRRVRRYLETVAVPLQFSVFAAAWSARERILALECLEQLIDPGSDDLRLYPVPLHPASRWLGGDISGELLNGGGASAKLATLLRRDYRANK